MFVRRGAFAVALLVMCLGLRISSALAQHLTEQWVEKTAQPLIDDRLAEGLSIGYLEGEHYGTVHLGKAAANGKKATNATLYEIGSVSKVFTSLLLADAVVRGDIELKSAADIPNQAGIRLPSRDGRAITWLDLSTHRSGLPRLPGNLAPTDLTNPYAKYDSRLAAEFLNQYQLTRSPGEKQEYSNLAVSVLGYLVAQKSGKPYQQLLRERIADPLKMVDCTIALSDAQVQRFATPHDASGDANSPWTFADLPGAGGIRGTMRDMLRFARAQLTPPDDTLGKAIDLAWQQQTAADPSGAAMGLGWMIAGDGQTRWHNGQTGGFHAALFINRELHTAVVVLCNTATNEVDQLAMQLMQKAAGKEAPAPANNAPVAAADGQAIDAKLRSRLVGRYQLTPKFIFDVRDRGGHLMVGITNQPTQEVFPDSATRWSYRGVDATLEFTLPESGPAKSLILHQNGQQQTARRID